MMKVRVKTLPMGSGKGMTNLRDILSIDLRGLEWETETPVL